jgi:uncharacterized protein DUF1501
MTYQDCFHDISVRAGARRAFRDALVELGVADRVTTFTVSDFGRTLSTNGNGSDHAWGGNHLVMGGAVAGGRVYGSYPASLAPGSDLAIRRARAGRRWASWPEPSSADDGCRATSAVIDSSVRSAVVIATLASSMSSTGAEPEASAVTRMREARNRRADRAR